MGLKVPVGQTPWSARVPLDPPLARPGSRARTGLAIIFLVAGAAAAAPVPTFSHDVAPLIYHQCASCHRPGGVGPFSLITYQDAAKRARLIATVTTSRYMPPWLPAEPHFQHERRLSESEIATLTHWAEGGAPQGNPAETPAPPKFPEGWQLGKPDFEGEMLAPYSVPA